MVNQNYNTFRNLHIEYFKIAAPVLIARTDGCVTMILKPMVSAKIAPTSDQRMIVSILDLSPIRGLKNV